MRPWNSYRRHDLPVPQVQVVVHDAGGRAVFQSVITKVNINEYDHKNPTQSKPLAKKGYNLQQAKPFILKNVELLPLV